MLTLKIPVLILTIFFALIGVYLAARIYIAQRRIDPATLRVRAFLNESFLKEKPETDPYVIGPFHDPCHCGTGRSTRGGNG
ncbi:MAG: hypothetical protein WA130_16840 [Candidatus Methanoperedens sp.]